MVNRSTSNQQGEVAKVTETEGNIVKRTDGPVKPTDTAPNSEPVAEQPKKPETDE